ncbi:MAG: protocatechuate 3,4-dioxygenase, alpha subunit [Solirubrobacteraceae bacterium]|jgi:protocatechuate 3,4-dioxygenase alpha subunit|nr:protocatechuate 3,4-dioxygenase, alpha subunit [Solirubrobacteraceae bacterium]
MLTPAQTVGPYLSLGLPWDAGPVADPDGITVRGRVLDGDGAPIPDALVETWQTTPRAFARCATDDDGRWSVTVPMPGADGAGQPPHLAVNVFARGLLHRLVTRIYFAEGDVLVSVPADRRATLVATPEDGAYRFDIRLQGDGETVFFDV